MSLQSMMSSGISGVDCMSSMMSVISNNVANVNSIAQKGSSVTFQDVLAGSYGPDTVGNGASLAFVKTDFGDGPVEATSNPTDMAISGKGFFMLRDPLQTEANLYSRDGQFKLTDPVGAGDPNALYSLTSPDGYKLQGINLGSVTPQTGKVEDIVIQRALPPKATENVTVAVNLQNDPAKVEQIDQPLYSSWNGTKSPAIADGNYDFHTVTSAYDDSGNKFDLTIYFDHTTNANEQEFLVTCDPAMDQRLINGGPARYSDPPLPSTGALMYGKLSFNSSGEIADISCWNVPAVGPLVPDPANRLQPVPGTDSYKFAYNTSGGDNNLSANLNFGQGPIQTTSYASDSFTLFQNQDGYGKGYLESVSVDKDGVITGSYSNDQNVKQAQVALADFSNYRGLTLGNGNNFLASSDAGQRVLSTAGQDSLGTISGNALEDSNVDLGKQFTDLILTQRSFQANAKSISTADEIYQTVIRMT